MSDKDPLEELPEKYRNAIEDEIEDEETRRLVAELLLAQRQARQKYDDQIRQHEVEDILEGFADTEDDDE